MYFKVISGTIWGMQAYLISVEADICNGMPFFNMVGMLASEVKEARERVRSAIRNSGFEIRPQRITINMSPADRRKAGVSFDLPIALAILAANGSISTERLNNIIVLGELCLDGEVRKVNGVLPIIMEAKEKGITHCIIPYENYMEAREVDGINIIPVTSLKEAIVYINTGKFNAIYNVNDGNKKEKDDIDFNQIKGNLAVRRAVEIAAAGRHNLLMIGPPGSGKSMIASRIPGILAPLTRDEKMEIAKIYSICGKLIEGVSEVERPFREPHHTITMQGMIGGGKYPTPGEITLSHKGVLFLDELPEFNPMVIDSLRQPIEERKVTLSRVSGSYEFEADALIIAAMNPCKCGYYPDRSRCSCTDEEVRRYAKRISGAIIDRIDICIEVPNIKYNDFLSKEQIECSCEIQKRVEMASNIQNKRYKDEKNKYNGNVSSNVINEVCILDKSCRDILQEAFEKFNLSTRNYYKMIRIARTIADLEQSVNIEVSHITEALGYSIFSRKYWK